VFYIEVRKSQLLTVEKMCHSIYAYHNFSAQMKTKIQVHRVQTRGLARQQDKEKARVSFTFFFYSLLFVSFSAEQDTRCPSQNVKE
jgi:hypothetical protein